MKRVFLLVSVVVCAQFLLAQNTIRGVVVDDNNQPVIGASVMVEGTSNAVVTDFDGAFEISVEEGTKLSIAMLGYRPVEQNAAQDMVVVLRKKGAGSSADGWRMFIMANGVYAPTMNDYGVGLTIGAVKTFGAYTSFSMTPIGDLMKLPDDRSQWKTSDFLYSNAPLQSIHLSWTAGFVAGKKVYFYGGVGCGYFERYQEAYSLGGYVSYNDVLSYRVPLSGRENPAISLAYEGGLLTNIKGFSLGVGVSAMSDFVTHQNYWNLKLSIGGNFSLRRK